MEHTTIPTVQLCNHTSMPVMGFGVAGLGTGPAFYTAMDAALEEGYRFFDAAPFYENEAQVGEVIRGCGLPRNELFFSSKLPNAAHRYDDTLRAVDQCLKVTGLTYLDMFLIHFPVPSLDLYCEAWRAMERLYREGVIRVIGVSNFQEHHLQKVFDSCEIRPMTNEIECNPYLTVRPLCEFCQKNDIRVINWFPLGGPKEPLVPYPVSDFPFLLDEPVLQTLGKKYGKSPAQIVLRWAIDHQISPIPKSSNPARIRENRMIFDFSLTQEELDQIDVLNYDRRFGPDPNTFDDMTMG